MATSFEDFDAGDWCSENEDFCVDTDGENSFPDLAAVCEGSFPIGTFEGTNF